MKGQQGAIIFLKGVVVLIGMAVFVVALFLLPVMANKDAAAHPDTMYVSYLFLLYAYVLCTPFFIALYQAYLLLTNISCHNTFSASSIKALSSIKHCAMTIIVLLVVGIALPLLLFYGKEDVTGPMMLALISIFGASVIAAFAAVLHWLVQQTLEAQSENKLTI
ncbi:DUF2975 domain-containing protein [Lysinibacillus sp. FSL H8-0500]|uniref:DUF2975 domain-containing protein n=1 Tax=Lysinibacillus sp. FSL H8-0500 TaxID=2921393 RepID=UPI003101B21D